MYSREQRIKSPLNYVGGKYRLLPQILPLFPNNITSFVDLFCGGGNVAVNVNAQKYYYNDIQDKLIGLLKTIKSKDTDSLIDNIDNKIIKFKLSNSSKNGYDYYNTDSSIGLCDYNREKYLKLRDEFNELEECDDTYYETLYLLIIYAFNNQIRFNKKGNYNLPVGKRDFNNKIRNNLIEFSEEIKKQNIVFSSISFNEFDISKLDEESFVYCDPPYLITTAVYNENDGWSENNEKELLMFLDKLDDNNVKFALSNVIEHKGKSNDILKSWIKDRKYIVHYLNYNYNNSNYQSKNTDKITQEVLITNY